MRKILNIENWKLLKEAEGDGTEQPKPEEEKALNLIMYDSPRTVVMNNLNKLKTLIRGWSKELVDYHLEDIEVSGGRGIRDPYLKFTLQKDNLLFDFVLFCPTTQARKGKALNTVGGYYGTIVMNDTQGFQDEGRPEDGEKNPMISKKVIDLVTPEKIGPSWLKEQLEDLLKETDNGTSRDPIGDGDKKTKEVEEDTF